MHQRRGKDKDEFGSLNHEVLLDNVPRHCRILVLLVEQLQVICCLHLQVEELQCKGEQ